MRKKALKLRVDQVPFIDSREITRSLEPGYSASGTFLTTDVNYKKLEIRFNLHLYFDNKGHLKLHYRGLESIVRMVSPRSKFPSWLFLCGLGCRGKAQRIYFTGGPDWGCKKCLYLAPAKTQFEIRASRNSRDFHQLVSMWNRKNKTARETNDSLAAFMSMVERYRKEFKRKPKWWARPA